jgi:hypothetical protein
VDIAARLEMLETRNALIDLVSGYAHAFDRHQPDLLRTVFADDAVLDLAEFGTYTGMAEILGAAEQFWAAAPHMHHWMANPLLDIDLEQGAASAVTALDCLCTYVESGTAHIGGRYLDRFARIDARWVIVERVFDLAFVTPMPSWKPAQGSEAQPGAEALAQAR